MDKGAYSDSKHSAVNNPENKNVVKKKIFAPVLRQNEHSKSPYRILSNNPSSTSTTSQNTN